MFSKFKCFGVAVLSVLICGFVDGQNNQDFNTVLLFHTFYVGARVHSTTLFEGRYISADVMTFDVLEGNEERVSSLPTYAIHCKSPRRIARVVSKFNLNTKPQDKPRWGVRFEKDEYEKGFYLNAVEYRLLNEFNESHEKMVEDTLGKRLPVFWPRDYSLVVEYACAVAENKKSAKTIAVDLVKTGGSAKVKELFCELKFGNKAESSGTVRFDEDLGFVQLNDRWMSKPFVNGQQLGFSINETAYRIAEKNGKVDATVRGDVVGVGARELAQNTPKKF